MTNQRDSIKDNDNVLDIEDQEFLKEYINNLDFDYLDCYEFIPASESDDGRNYLVIRPAKTMVDLDNEKTKQQFDALKDFLNTNFPNILYDSMFVKNLKNHLNTYYQYYSAVHEQNTQPVKINLDSSAIDDAISKVDRLTDKLKTAKLLMNSISDK